MKISKELHYIQRDLQLNFKLNNEYQAPNDVTLLEKWKKLIKNINDILQTGKCDMCYQEIYVEINNLLIYDITNETIIAIDNCLQSFANKTLIDCMQIINKDNFLDRFNSIWSTVINRFILIQKILIKFEKKAFQSRLNNNLYNQFIEIFKEKSTKEYEKSIFNYLIEEINKAIVSFRISVLNNKVEFNEEIRKQHLDIIALGIELLIESRLYNDYFNTHFIESSVKYYESLSITFTLEEFISFVNKVLDLETTIVTNHLNQISFKPMINQVNHIFIVNKCDSILNKYYSDENKDSQGLFVSKYELMNKIYALALPIGLEDKITSSFSSYIFQITNKIYEKYSSNCIDLFEYLYLLKQNIDSFVRIAFVNNEKIKTVGKDSLTKAINLKPNYIAELLSRYIDLILKSNTEDKAQFEKQIEEFMIIFKLLEAKDAFEKYYIQKLLYRCLYSQAIKKERELLIIDYFQKECGSNFVNKSEEILNDMIISDTLTKEYNSIMKESNLYSFYIFSNYSWPFNTMLTGFVNNDITEIESIFSDYYKQKNQGRILNWVLPFSQCELCFKLDNAQYLIKANGFHASILLKYTKLNKSHKIGELVKSTKIERNDLLSYLKAIIDIGILTYNSNNDSYDYNEHFTSNNEEIILTNLSTNEAAKNELDKIEVKTFEDRKPVIDCYVIKIVKAKKQIKFNDLIIEVHNSLKFPCERQMIISRITYLLKADLIVKDERNEGMIKYC